MMQRRKSVADLSSNDFDLQENFKTRPFFSFSSHDMNPVIGHQTLLVVGTHQIWQHDLNKGVLSWNICGKVGVCVCVVVGGVGWCVCVL